MKEYWTLFWTFCRIGGLTFGGGYAMLPMLEKEVVERHHWTTQDQLLDYFAIGQCTPGIIAVNTATFIGYKYKGWLGGVIATLGVVFPSIVIITLIAAFLTNFADYPVVAHALAGINACVVALIASSVLRLGRTNLTDGVSAVIFVVVLALGFFVGVSPVILIVCAGVVGYVAYRLLKLSKGGDDK